MRHAIFVNRYIYIYMGIIHIEKYRYPSDIRGKISTTNIFRAIWLLWIEERDIREARAISRFLIKLWRNPGDAGKFIGIKFERRYYARVDKRIGSPDWRRAVTTLLRVSAREALVKRRRMEQRHVELETDLRRATALPGFIGHSEENRLSCGHRCAGVCARGICHACPASEKGPIRSSLCVPMMPSLQRGPTKSILTPSQIDGPSPRVCLGHAALTYVPTPHNSPIHISLLFFHLPRPPPPLLSLYLLNVTFEKTWKSSSLIPWHK